MSARTNYGRIWLDRAITHARPLPLWIGELHMTHLLQADKLYRTGHRMFAQPGSTDCSLSSNIQRSRIPGCGPR